MERRLVGGNPSLPSRSPGRLTQTLSIEESTTLESFNRIFGVPKPVIAMLHLPALPGRPLHDRSEGVTGAVDGVARDLEALQAAGVDGLLFCNEADLPYQLEVGHEISAAMASIVGQLRSSVRVPFGVNILWDPIASLAVARATGARFIREVLTGVYESDLGMIEPHIGNIAGYRAAIGGDDIALFDNIAPEFASAIGSRGVAERAKAAAFLRMDAILISGPAAGVPFEMSDLRIAKEAAPEAADHRQHRRSGGSHRGDLRGRRWRHRRDEPQGGRPYMEPGRPGPGESADGGRALGALIGLGLGSENLCGRTQTERRTAPSSVAI